MNDRLYRSRDDRVIGGVCAGLADRLDLDPSLVRIGWVVLTFLTGGLLILLYIVMLIVVPEEPAGGPVPSVAPEPGAIPGWTPPGAGTGWTPGGVAPDVGASAAGASAMAGDAAPGGTPSGPAPAPGWVPPSASAPYPDSRAGRRAERRAARAERRRSADPVVALVLGGILVLLGVYFLLQQYVPSLDLERFWPVVIIGIGVLLVVRAVSRPRPEA